MDYYQRRKRTLVRRKQAVPLRIMQKGHVMCVLCLNVPFRTYNLEGGKCFREQTIPKIRSILGEKYGANFDAVMRDMDHKKRKVCDSCLRVVNKSHEFREDAVAAIAFLKKHVATEKLQITKKQKIAEVEAENSNVADYLAEPKKIAHLVDTAEAKEIRNIVRELEQAAREILILLQTIHQQNGLNNISSMCDEAIQMFRTVQEKFGRLGVLVPRGQYYRFHDHWRFVMQRLSFLASLVTYLSSEKLASREEVAFNLGVEVKREDGFHIDLDDYLMGLLHMASELSRLTVNSVTSGDYARPLRIARFLGELDAGFRLLNLKNDSLRKRFDGLKYDIKKVEEVVYDLSIRNLAVFGEDPKQPGAKKDAPSTSTSKSIVGPDTLVTGASTSKSTVAPDPPVTEVSTDAEPTESSDEPCEQIDLLEAAVKQTVGDELKTIGEAMDTHQDENNMQTGSPRHVTSAPSGQESEISIPEQPVVTPDMPGGGQQDLLTEGKTIQPTTHGMSGLPASHIQAPQRQPTPPGPTFSAGYGQPVVSMPQDQSHFPPSQEQTVFSAAHMQPGITQEQASFTAQHGQPSFQAMQGQPLIPMQHGQTVPPSFPSTQHGQQAIPAAQEQPAFSAPYGQTVFAGTQEQGYPSSQGQLSYPVTHEQQGYQVPQLQPGYQVQPGYTAAPTQPLVPQVHPGFPAADGHSVYPDPQGQSSYPGLQGQDAHYPPPPP